MAYANFVSILVYVSNLLPILALLSLQTPRTAIEGVVSRIGTDQPIAGVRVTLTTESDFTTALRTTETDRSGKFSFTGLQPGAYRIGTDREGYALENWLWSLRVPTLGTTQVTAEANRTASVRIHLIPEAVVTGRIVGPSGEPVVNGEVRLVVLIFDSSGRRTYATSAVVSTNDRGEYRFYGLRPGRYYMHAGEPGILSLGSVGRLPDTGNEIGKKYKLTYYPGTAEISEATLINVKAGQTQDKIDFALRERSLKKYSIQGRIIPADSPATTMQYSFYAASSEAVTSRRINTAAADGTFEIADIEPGTYVIQAQMQSPVIRPAPGESVPLFPTVYAVATVDVVDSDVTGVLLRLRTATLVGKVHLENQADVPATLQVQLKITNGNSPAPAVVKNDGTFEISRVSTGVPYSLSVLGLPPDMYLKEARMGTSDVRNQPLKISEASSVLNIEIGTNGGSIAGIVRRPDGRAAGGAKLTLLPRDRDRRDLFRFATSGEDGQFVFRGIPPGEYKVFAFDSTTENFAAFNEGWIRSYEQKGILLQAKPGQKETVDLVLISEP